MAGSLMPCEHLDLGDGVKAIVCSHGPRKFCQFCKQRPVARLCDWKTGKHETCDAAMCLGCSVNVAPEKDLCPPHSLAWERWKAAHPNLSFPAPSREQRQLAFDPVTQK